MTVLYGLLAAGVEFSDGSMSEQRVAALCNFRVASDIRDKLSVWDTLTIGIYPFHLLSQIEAHEATGHSEILPSLALVTGDVHWCVTRGEQSCCVILTKD
jgi:hypothetical protein